MLLNDKTAPKKAVTQMSFWWPLMPPINPPEPIVWTGRKRFAAVFGGLCAGGFLAFAIIAIYITPHINTVTQYYWYTTVLSGVAFALGAGTLLALRYVGGVRCARLNPRRARSQFWHGLGYNLRFVVLTGVISVAVLRLVQYKTLFNLWPSDTPKWFVGYVLETFGLGGSSAFAEEIIATVFLYWLMERVQLRSGKNLAATVWGATIIVAAHLSYHLYYGIDVLRMVVPLYFTVLCWRYTRSITALVVGHFLWDAIASIPTSLGPQLIIWTGLGLSGFMLDSLPWNTPKSAEV